MYVCMYVYVCMGNVHDLDDEDVKVTDRLVCMHACMFVCMYVCVYGQYT
jgi:hypothetical protein